MSNISFDNVYLLLIAVPLIVLFTVPFALAIRKDNRNGHNVASQVLHVVMAVLIAFVAAGTNITTVLSETHVYVVADVSFSARNNLDIIDDYITNMDLPRGAKLGLVCYGKDYELVGALGDPKKVPSVKTATVDDSETNTAEALSYAGTLFPAGVIKRVVLITDAKDSDARDANAIRRAVDGLAAQNVKVDAVFIDDNIREDEQEVQISGVEFTPNVFTGSAEKVRVSVQSSYETFAVVTLRKDGVSLETKPVDLTLGLNTIGFTLDTTQAGTFEYELSVVAEGDGVAENNTYAFTQKVFDTMHLLVVTGAWDDCTALISRYGSRAQMDIYESDSSVATAVKTAYKNQLGDNIDLHINDTAVPVSVEDFCKYDEIILADVDISTLTSCTAFVDGLYKAVSVLGKSLITVGNLYIQNRGDNDLKQLEDMLPVKFGNSEEDPKLYTLVIDGSRSMETLGHLVIAKQVATHLVNLLNDKDEICIVTFFGDVRIVQEPVPLINRNAVIEKINGIELIQGTLISKGLSTAANLITNLDYADKQVMLITDGLSYTDESDDPVAIAEEMYRNGIVTSVFDVGRQGDAQDGSGSNPDGPSNTAKTTLQRIARVGSGFARNSSEKGNYYYSPNVEFFEQIDFGPLADSLTESVVRKDTAVSVGRRTDSVLSDIDAAQIPAVSGYVYSKTEADATTVLFVEHERASGTVQKPLYAYRNQGIGRVASFTSSFNEDWLARWESAGLSGVFFENVLQTCVPTQKTAVPYTVAVLRKGKYSRVEVALVEQHFGTAAKITVTDPDGETLEGEMSVSLGNYYFEMETARVGKYEIRIDYLYNGTAYSADTTVHIAYADEYDVFAVYESSPLHRAIDGRGSVIGDALTAEKEVLKIRNGDDEVGKRVVELTAPLLMITVVLLIADIVIRKLKWEDIVSFFGLRKNGGGKR